MARAVVDLVAATGSRRGDQRVNTQHPHGGEEHEFADLHRDVVMLGTPLLFRSSIVERRSILYPLRAFDAAFAAKLPYRFGDGRPFKS